MLKEQAMKSFIPLSFAVFAALAAGSQAALAAGSAPLQIQTRQQTPPSNMQGQGAGQPMRHQNRNQYRQGAGQGQGAGQQMRHQNRHQYRRGQGQQGGGQGQGRSSGQGAGYAGGAYGPGRGYGQGAGPRRGRVPLRAQGMVLVPMAPAEAMVRGGPRAEATAARVATLGAMAPTAVVRAAAGTADGGAGSAE